MAQMVRICTSHSLTVSASTALLGGTRTVVCSVYLFRHICVCPRWATSSRGARGPVGGSDWTRTSDLIAIAMRSIPLNYAPVVCPDLSGSRSPVASWPARPLVMGCAPSLLPACQVMLSRFLRLTFTAGNDPVFPGADSRIRTGQDVLDTASLSPPLCVSACGRPTA